MSIKLTSLGSGRTVRMRGETFANLLSLAQLGGWQTSHLATNWAAPSADTEMLLEQIAENTRGLVSKTDATGLVEALANAMKHGGAALEPDLYLAVLDVTSMFGKSGFTVTDAETGETVVFRR